MLVFIFDLDEVNDYAKEFEPMLIPDGISFKDVVEVGVSVWLEMTCAHRFANRLTKDEVISLVLGDRFPIDEMDNSDSVFLLAEVIFLTLDGWMQPYINPHSMTHVEFGGWMGSSILVKAERVIG